MWFVLVLVVASNRVTPIEIPPNDIILSGNVYLGSSKTKVICYWNFTSNAVTTMPSTVVLSSSSLIKNNHTVTDYVYAHYQTAGHNITGEVTYPTTSAANTIPTMQMAMSELATDVSVIYDFYGESFLYLGEIPESFRAHMISLGRTPIAGPLTLDAIPITVTNGGSTTTMNLNLGAVFHDCNAADTGTWTIDGTSIDITCKNGTNSGTSIISAYALGIGVHVSTDLDFYKPNNHEFDHVTAGFIIALLLLYFGTWLMWTRDLPTDIVSPSRRRSTWIRISHHYVPINCAIMLLIMSRNMWSAAQDSHGLYNIETIDMIGLAHLRVYVQAYAFGFTPLVVGTTLILFAYGNSVHRPAESTETTESSMTDTIADPVKFFTWGSEALNTWRLSFRVLLFFGAQAAAIIIVIVFWIYAMQNGTSAALSAVYTSLVLLYWSSASRIQWKLRHRYAALSEHDAVLLLYISWSVRVLILLSITANTPYDIGGVFAVQFHTFVSIGAGILVAIITGRTAGMMDRVGGIESLVMFSAAGIFALSFSVLFGLGSMYGSTGALRDHPNDSALCAIVGTSLFATLGYGYEWRRRR